MGIIPAICIPTKRKPPLATVRNYTIPYGLTCYLIADPDVYEHHKNYYEDRHDIVVLRGVKGMCAQVAECYRQANAHDHDWFLRLDDDLPPQVFVRLDGHRPGLYEIIEEMYQCAVELEVTLVGLNRSSHLKQGYEHCSRNSYGFVNFAVSTDKPETFVDASLQKREIEYRVCAHRKFDGKPMGVVKHIRASYQLVRREPTVTDISLEEKNRALLTILERFPEYVYRTDLARGEDGSVVTMKFRQPAWKPKVKQPKFIYVAKDNNDPF